MLGQPRLCDGHTEAGLGAHSGRSHVASLVGVKSNPCPGSGNIVNVPRAAPSQVGVLVGSRPPKPRGQGSGGSLGASKDKWLRGGWVCGGKSRAGIGAEGKDTRVTDCVRSHPGQRQAGGASRLNVGRTPVWSHARGTQRWCHATSKCPRPGSQLSCLTFLIRNLIKD